MEKSKKQQNTGKLIIVLAMIALLIAILCLGGITFSKYVTSSGEVSKTATVAKWGFVVNVTANDLFPSDYTLASGTLATKATGEGVAVNASDAVVAPGTTGSLTFSIKGTAEVLAQLKITASGEDFVLKYQADKGTDYYPIKWTLKKGDAVVGQLQDKKLSEIVAGINELGAYYDAGTSVDDTYTLSWVWDFSNGHDTEDTILGLIAAGQTTGIDSTTYNVSGSVTSVTFKLTISIEQVQTRG